MKVVSLGNISKGSQRHTFARRFHHPSHEVSAGHRGEPTAQTRALFPIHPAQSSSNSCLAAVCYRGDLPGGKACVSVGDSLAVGLYESARGCAECLCWGGRQAGR